MPNDCILTGSVQARMTYVIQAAPGSREAAALAQAAGAAASLLDSRLDPAVLAAVQLNQRLSPATPDAKAESQDTVKVGAWM